MTMSAIRCPKAFAEAAAEYHSRPVSDFSTGLLRLEILEALGGVPAQSLAAFVALDMGDDAEARARLKFVVEHVREAARLFNDLTAGGGA